MKRTNILLTLTLVLLVVSAPVSAQRIGIGEGSTDESGRADTEARNDESSAPDTKASGRIIPPEDFGKYRKTDQKESELSKDALLEKIRADSAAMGIRYEERLRQLRSDSEAMRETIEELRDRIAKLRGQSGGETDDTGSREPILKRSDRSSTGMDARPETRTEADRTRQDQPDTSSESETESDRTETEESDDESTIPSDRRLNPNTASLSDLKSIPDLSNRLAERIEWYRREVTPFEDIQDLKRVPGIDRQVFDRIQDFFHEGPY